MISHDIKGFFGGLKNIFVSLSDMLLLLKQIAGLPNNLFIRTEQPAASIQMVCPHKPQGHERQCAQS
jgi:hypothetical protein